MNYVLPRYASTGYHAGGYVAANRADAGIRPYCDGQLFIGTI